MLNFKKVEEQIFLIEDLSKNITPEYWPHQLFLEDDNYAWVKPEYFYPHFRCLMAIVDPHLSDDAYELMEDIEAELFRFFLWLNNNSVITEDYTPTIKANSRTYKSELENECMQKIMYIAKLLYVQIAPQIYYTINSNEGETVSFFNYFKDVKITLEKIISTLPSETEESITEFSSNIFGILVNQGIK